LTGKKPIRGYLNRVRRNIRVLDEAIEVASKSAKSERPGDKRARLKLLRDLVELQGATLRADENRPSRLKRIQELSTISNVTIFSIRPVAFCQAATGRDIVLLWLLFLFHLFRFSQVFLLYSKSDSASKYSYH